MESKISRVVIMYLLWDKEPYAYLEDALYGVSRQSYPKELTELLIVYNSHQSENQSACPFIRETVTAFQEPLPLITILEQSQNLGFSGGNNLGMQWAIDNNFDYVFLHNGDGYLGRYCLEKMIQAFSFDQSIGLVQALILLHPQTDLINTAGNCLHFLGLGYGNLYRHPKNYCPSEPIQDIGYASGAAVLMRTEILRQHGLWDEDFFMYHEDTDYSLRLRLLGFRVVLARQAEFFHKYQFSRSIKKYYWMERNRRAIVLLFYRLPTILLILPLALFFDLALFIFSLRSGWVRQLLLVYWYWLQPKHWRLWLKKRKKIQLTRCISDRELLQVAVSIITFQEATVANPILRYIGNPIMQVYWKIVYFFVRW